MPATAEPPAVPPAAPAAPAKPSIAEQAAKTTIDLSKLARDTVPEKPPKPGTARARLFDDMKKKLGGDSTSPPPASKPDTTPAKASEASPAPEAAETTGGGDSTPPPPSATDKPADAPATAQTPTETASSKKVSPWKLVDEHKAARIKAEQENVELRKSMVDPAKVKELETKIQQLESKAKEMTEELRFVDAEKYDPDVKKAKEDYNRAFNRAMKELKEITVTDPGTQQPRPLTVNDLAELAFMPLGQAQQVAKDVFGDLAPYVMDHRNEIRKLWDEHEAIKDDLKKNGATRMEQRMQESQKQAEAIAEFVTKTYEQANTEAAADPKHGHFFKPREGDTEWNARLEKGFKLVDEAFTTNALDPKLSKEQRQDVIRKHAAVRNRAAAFGPLRWRVESLEKQLKEAMVELKQYKETTPTTTGRAAEPVQERKKGMAGLMDEIQKIAH